MQKPQPIKKREPRRRVESPLAKNLSRVLAERGLTQRAAAEICGVSQSVIADWCNGGMCNNPLALQKLVLALKVNFEWLLTGTTSSVPASELSLTEIFEEHDSAFSGIFKIEAKRLTRRSDK